MYEGNGKSQGKATFFIIVGVAPLVAIIGGGESRKGPPLPFDVRKER